MTSQQAVKRNHSGNAKDIDTANPMNSDDDKNKNNNTDSNAQVADVSSYSFFCNLPEEIIMLIYSYADIASLGLMSQIHRGVLSRCALDNRTWAELVKRRFQIRVEKTWPKRHGGRNWKEAYRTMSHCNRAPECRYTRKVIFAKGGSGSTATNYGSSSSSGGGGKGKGGYIAAATVAAAAGVGDLQGSGGTCRISNDSNVLSVWVLLRHTESCRTRRIPGSSSSSERYVEFTVCLQNTKSTVGTIHVNVLGSKLLFVDEIQPCMQNGQQSFGPRIIHRPQQMYTTKTTATIADHPHKFNNIINGGGCIDNEGVKLRPFEYCVVSMQFRCGRDMFETDVLARSVALTIPVVVTTTATTTTTTSASSNISTTMKYAVASFIPEKDVWQYYNALPGGCLSLSERYLMSRG